MKQVENKFGSGTLFETEDIEGKVYVACTACMSIYSEFLSWANINHDRFVKYPNEADSIIVLSCQVTDLAILNDLKTLEDLIKNYDHDIEDFYVGGCLAKRFDIELPNGVMRLDNVYSDGTYINNTNLIDYKHPFWVKDFKEENNQLKDGNLFRNMYLLRIGVGCHGKCKYCTIRITRGEPKEIKPNINEFLEHDDIVLIADSPTADQILEWCCIAEYYHKPISIRNIEPSVVCKIKDNLISLAEHGLLKIFHCPIQHTNIEVLKDMNRNVIDTLSTLFTISALKLLGVICATNIIIDYKHFQNPDFDYLNSIFDYISWNPYWDGKWNRKIAEERYEYYINSNFDYNLRNGGN